MYYLTKSYEEVLDDYTILHEKQAAPDLYAWKDFHDLLLEPESIVEFNPKEWREEATQPYDIRGYNRVYGKNMYTYVLGLGQPDKCSASGSAQSYCPLYVCVGTM